jgi:hypothetical protein
VSCDCHRARPNFASRQNLFKLRGIVFIHATQVIDASSKNAFIYGGSASGLTIPINANDPTGLLEVNYLGGGATVRNNLQNAYNRFSATPTGGQIVNKIDKSYDVLNIRYDSSPGATSGFEPPSTWNKVQGFFGWNVANVTITPQTRMPLFSDSSGNMIFRTHTTQEVINHELPHVTGTLDNGPYGLNTVKVQNQIATEMGIPYQRLTYPGYTAGELSGWGSVDSINALPNSAKGNLFNTLRGPIDADYSGGNLSAAGGYLLYPNKPNNNMMQSVYRK